MKDRHRVSESLSILHRFFAENGQQGAALSADQCRQISRALGDIHDAAVMLECSQSVYKRAHGLPALPPAPEIRITGQSARIIPFRPGRVRAAGSKI